MTQLPFDDLLYEYNKKILKNVIDTEGFNISQFNREFKQFIIKTNFKVK